MKTCKLVIVGGGAAGVLAALELCRLVHQYSFLSIVLIDNKEYLELTPSIISVLLHQDDQEFNTHFNKITMLYTEFFRNQPIEFVQATVEHITETSGSSYPIPFKPSSEATTQHLRLQELDEYRHKIREAKEILCIGGGPVGVEMAGEIGAIYPEKKLHLVHAKSQLLQGLPQKLGSKAGQSLQKTSQGIHLVLGEKALPLEANNVKKQTHVPYQTSETQQRMEPDLVLECSGIKPNSEAFKAHLRNCIDEQGYIKVGANLRVIGQEHMFCVGDVSNLNEAKLYFTAHMQAYHFVKNFKKILEHTNQYTYNTEGEAQAKKRTLNLLPYRGSLLNVMISLGPRYGVGCIHTLSITGMPWSRSGSRMVPFLKTIFERTSLSPFWLRFINTVLYYSEVRWFYGSPIAQS